MSLIEITKNKLEKIFRDNRFHDNRKPHNEALALEYFLRSKQFLSSAVIVENEAKELSMPYLHLQGQSIELALKGFLLASKEEPNKIHDLVELTSNTENVGLKLKQVEASMIVLLNHYFYQDLTTSTKFKSRYPAKSQETTGGPMPDQKVVVDLQNSIFLQAKKKCEFLNLLP
jgi:HEPN domain-containing protein